MSTLKQLLEKINYILNNFNKLDKKKYFLKNILLEQLEYLYELENAQKESYSAEVEEEQKNTLENLKTIIYNEEEHTNNIIMEIRPGTGGDEASLFAMDLLKMYTKYCEKLNFKLENMDIKFNKEQLEFACIRISGQNCSKYFEYEPGVHRVQRIPETESKGRIHTSTATVNILPDVKDIDIQINPKDLKIETCRASGAGGQHVNKTESAVRIVHLPTNISVECQEERSQLDNRDKALKMLKLRLYQKYKSEQQKEISQNRKSQVAHAGRSEKSRTYNYKENRVTDHERKYTIYALEKIIKEGNLSILVNKLQEIDEKNYNVLIDIDQQLNKLIEQYS